MMASTDAEPTCFESLTLPGTTTSDPSNEASTPYENICAASAHCQQEGIATPSSMHEFLQHEHQAPTHAIHSPMREADGPKKILSVGAGLAPTASTRFTAEMLGSTGTSNTAQRYVRQPPLADSSY
ncbi:hypothetical protein CPC08DRAFT_710385 [Agrocybe pediades]|nr:hypothetical protein CPC08DRAFT_710385 [Agrocybe pediades]